MVPQLLEQDQGPIFHFRGQCSESRTPQKLHTPARDFLLAQPMAVRAGKHRKAVDCSCTRQGQRAFVTVHGPMDP